MTTQELRLAYKRDTGRTPTGDYLYLNGRIINTGDKDLTLYIKWLEEELLKRDTLIKKLIPWESPNNF